MSMPRLSDESDHGQRAHLRKVTPRRAEFVQDLQGSVGLAAVVVAVVVREADAVERRADAAAFALPGLCTLLDRDAGDEQADSRVEPPRPGDRVAQQPDEKRPGQVGAE